MTDNIEELRSLANKLLMLLADPHPGLVTWQMLLHSTIDKIAEFNGK